MWHFKKLRNGQESIYSAGTAPWSRTCEHRQSSEQKDCSFTSKGQNETLKQSPLQLGIVFDSFCCCYTNTLTMCLVYFLCFSDPRQ